MSPTECHSFGEELISFQLLGLVPGAWSHVSTHWCTVDIGSFCYSTCFPCIKPLNPDTALASSTTRILLYEESQGSVRSDRGQQRQESQRPVTGASRLHL